MNDPHPSPDDIGAGGYNGRMMDAEDAEADAPQWLSLHQVRPVLRVVITVVVAVPMVIVSFTRGDGLAVWLLAELPAMIALSYACALSVVMPPEWRRRRAAMRSNTRTSSTT